MLNRQAEPDASAGDVEVLEFAASRCEIANMQTPAVMAAIARLARERPDAQEELGAFWHALQLRRPAARVHDADRALRSIRRRLNG